MFGTFKRNILFPMELPIPHPPSPVPRPLPPPPDLWANFVAFGILHTTDNPNHAGTFRQTYVPLGERHVSG